MLPSVPSPSALKKIITVVMLMALLPACAWFNTYHKKKEVSSHGYTAVDAKQRFLLYGSRPGEDGEAGSSPIYCAEPSPDALSAFASALDLSAQNKKAVLATVKSAMTESAATIGIRTQSIQLLRDAMFRNCEAYMSGAIDSGQFDRLQRSYQKSMVTLVAIEQLARAVAPGQVTINSAASRTSAQNIVELKKLLDTATEGLAKSEKKLSEAQTAFKTQEDSLVEDLKKDKAKQTEGPDDLDAAKEICKKETGLASCKNYASLLKAKSDAEESLNKQKKVKDKLELAFDKADTDPNLSAYSAAGISYVPGSTQQAPEVSQHVAETVKSLVSMVYMEDFMQFCISNQNKLSNIQELAERAALEAKNVSKKTDEQEKADENKKALNTVKKLKSEYQYFVGYGAPAWIEVIKASSNADKSDDGLNTELVSFTEADSKKLVEKASEAVKIQISSCGKVINAYAKTLAKEVSAEP